MNSVIARKLAFGYEGGPAIFHDFDLSIPAGSFSILLGPNGSGKTTLLRILSGAIVPAAGEVRLFDQPINRMPAAERAKIVAVLPQESRVVFPFTARQIVLMGRAPHLGFLGFPGKADREIVVESMRATDCAAFASRRITELSSGERQRVYLARALAQRPRILLLDEPTTFLDLSHQVRFFELLENWHRREGITILAVSHDVTLAGLRGHRLILLNQGRVAAEGNADQVLTESRLQEVYGVKVRILKDPAGVGRIVLPP